MEPSEAINFSKGLNTLILINGATLIAIVSLGFKLVRFVSSMEFKLNILWAEYEKRNNFKPQILGSRLSNFNRKNQ